MEQRFDAKDFRLIAACLAIMALSLAIGVPFFYRAFPEAAIDFRLTRNQARDRARLFLASRGLSVEGYRHSAVFHYDPQTKVFLERELGLEGAKEVIGHPVRLWRWSHRWVRELQKEEFRVELATTGEWVGFAHLLEEDRPGAHLSAAQARALAEQFLVDTLGRPLASLEFVEANTLERPRRTDHIFTWKLSGFEIEGATYRLQIGIQGDQVGHFAEFLKIPQAWQRSYGELRSHNEAAQWMANLFLFLTLVAMLGTFFQALRRQEIRWKIALIFGSIAFGLTLLTRLNDLPVIAYTFDPTDTYASFLTAELLKGLFSAFLQGSLVFFLTAATEPLYRRRCRGQLRLGELFLPHGMRTKRFLIGSLIGLTMTTSFFAYQTVFYLVAERFGAWSPAEIPYDEMVNTYLPWIKVLLVGFLPAVSEEFIARAFSISFLSQYLKSRGAILAIPALIWGFGHAGYPQQPFFIRGLEVGIAGIGIGAIFLRWGLLPPLIWHYTVDALYTALILLRSHHAYFVASAILSAGLMLLPLVLALAFYGRRRFFIDPTPMLNQADSPSLTMPPVQPAPASTPEAQLLGPLPDSPLAPYRPLSWTRLALAAGAIALSLSAFLIEVEEPLKFARFAITAPQAKRLAAEYLRTLGALPDTFSVVTCQHHQLDAMALKYLLERVEVSQANRLYRQALRPSLWQVRFFRPGQQEEYRVTVDPDDGSIEGFHHLLDETAPGAELTEEEARAIAEAHLGTFGLEPSAFELKESSTERREARRDYYFVWEAREGDPRNLDELRFRCEVQVAGDRPVAFQRRFKLPEDWLRARQERTTLQIAFDGLRLAALFALALHLLWRLGRGIRSQGIAWKPFFKMGVLAGGVFLLDYLNALPLLYRDYDTHLSLPVFVAVRTAIALILLILVSLAILGSLASITALYPGWQRHLRAAARGLALRDALLTMALLLLADRSFGHLIAWVKERFAGHLSSPIPTLISGLDTVWPFWDGLSHALAGGAFISFLLGVMIYCARQIFKGPLLTAAVLLAFGLISAGAEAQNLGEFFLSLALFLLHASFISLAIVVLLRNNPLAYLLTGFAIAGIPRAQELSSLAAPTYQFHGALLALGMALCISYLLFRLRCGNGFSAFRKGTR